MAKKAILVGSFQIGLAALGPTKFRLRRGANYVREKSNQNGKHYEPGTSLGSEDRGSLSLIYTSALRRRLS